MFKLIIVLLINVSLLAQISASRLPRWAVFDSTDQISVTTDTLQVLTRSYLYGKTIIKANITADSMTINNAWTDLTFPFTTNRVNPTSSKPVFDATELTLNFEKDSVNCVMYMVGQMPHDYKIGSAIYPHVHIKGNTDSAYTFRLAYKWINIGDTANAGWSYKDMGTRANTTPANTVIHQILSSTTPITASDGWGESKGISSMLMMKIYRVDALAPTIVKGYAFDLHYQIDSFGSRQEFIK